MLWPKFSDGRHSPWRGVLHTGHVKETVMPITFKLVEEQMPRSDFSLHHQKQIYIKKTVSQWNNAYGNNLSKGGG